MEKWTTEELRRDFEVIGFLAPYVHVRRKSDGVEGSLQFTHMPRVYFDFVPSGRIGKKVTDLGWKHGLFRK